MPEMRQRTADSRREIRPESGATVLGLLDFPQMPNHTEFLRHREARNSGLAPMTSSGRDMSDQYTYARFWRCALQVNPVGYNGTYRGADHGLDEAGYNQALLQKCLELDITVVGLADHGSVASVDATRPCT